jgi:CRP/FNR family cyclic AMP-dependent transcriptional regulator
MKVSNVDNIPLHSHSHPPSLRTVVFEGDKSRSRVSDSSPKPAVGYSPFDIFQWLSTEAQEAFTLACRQRHFSDSCRIYLQSEPGNEMYRIVSGSVRMSVLRHDGREVLYLVLEPGDCFGIRSLLDGAPRSHTTNASGDVELQVLRRDACERLRCLHASFGDALIHLISHHMRLLSDYFVSSILDELPCRVAQRLLQAHQLSLISGHGIRPTVRLSQGEIALMVGASRQSVNRVLQKFQDDGLISIEYGRLRVRDTDRLRSATTTIDNPMKVSFPR